tara:strand:- start:97 stop:468 length:372 start_codon:yes stop_codon:yes gene_type:complete
VVKRSTTEKKHYNFNDQIVFIRASLIIIILLLSYQLFSPYLSQYVPLTIEQRDESPCVITDFGECVDFTFESSVTPIDDTEFINHDPMPEQTDIEQEQRDAEENEKVFKELRQTEDYQGNFNE